MDFFQIVEKRNKSNSRDADIVVYPDWLNGASKDLVLKGGGFYAVWDGKQWRQSLDDMMALVDRSILQRVEELKQKHPDKTIVGRMCRSDESGLMARFERYARINESSNVVFNKRIIFADEQITREDYATSQLNYTPTAGDAPAFDELVNKLYVESELEKILWFMGALLTNNMVNIQKFLYLYGGKGSGKGTIIKVFKMLFDGYHAPISLAHLTSDSEFATSQIKMVPLLIDDDSDMSRIRNDTNLLKMTAHEPVTVNAKYKHTYEVVFSGLLITASNQRYKVRNVDSGITRRAVVASPTSYTHDSKTYFNLMGRVKYELPQIAYKAMQVFDKLGPFHYEDYFDLAMAEATDHMFSFVREHAMVLGDTVTLKQAGELYKLYLEDLGFDTNGYKRTIKNELMRYYKEFHNQKRIDGTNVRNVFIGLNRAMIFPVETEETKEVVFGEGLDLTAKESIFDKVAEDYPAQLATPKETPQVAWDKCTTTLKDIDTTELHFVRVPLNHIVIDFDVKDMYGEKDLSRNLIAAAKFPPTYTELSKSGKGVHLHYIYDGDPSTLAAIYEDDIEIKVFTGKSSLRRKLTKCNDLPIAHITTGLPEKEKDGVKVYQDVEIITWNEKKMRTAVKGNLQKKYHGATKPSMDFIKHIFEQAEKSGVKYDLRDMRQDILVFATNSSNQAQECLKIFGEINFCTIDEVEDVPKLQANSMIVPEEDIVFFDAEVYPNLFVVVWKRRGAKEKTKWINPSPAQIESLVEKPLVGFNCRRYDNHILYARLLGEDLQSLYRQSQRIINDKDSKSGMYGAAYELSYADVFEYSSEKKSLAKWQIELGLQHDEMELPWDQPVPEHLWERVVGYCSNDVDSLESVFEARYQDYTARQILTTLSGLSMNATTTQHAAAFLFGKDQRPQEKFIYEDLSEMFPGYKYEYGKSEYRGEDPGEGGYVYAEPGVYENVTILDVTSMHPNSLINMNHFGPYTERFQELVNARVYIKHGEYDKARETFNGQLKPYLEDSDTADKLSYALKIIINIVYGMTSAKFPNKFLHPKNVDNIVAKRGALFMINLKHEVQERGFTVAHIKTDSIKIPNATQEIIDFVFEYGRKYGYEFEQEPTYTRMALINKSVYVSEYFDKKQNKMVWDAVGSRFAEPFVYKTLFSKEPFEESDYAITNQVQSSIYLGDRFIGKIARAYASYSGEDMWRVVDGERKGHVNGTKGYRWTLMSEYKGKDDIDMKYYNDLVDAAIKTIEKVGDVNKIIDPFYTNNSKMPIEDDEVPF